MFKQIEIKTRVTLDPAMQYICGDSSQEIMNAMLAEYAKQLKDALPSPDFDLLKKRLHHFINPWESECPTNC